MNLFRRCPIAWFFKSMSESDLWKAKVSRMGIVRMFTSCLFLEANGKLSHERCSLNAPENLGIMIIFISLLLWVLFIQLRWYMQFRLAMDFCAQGAMGGRTEKHSRCPNFCAFQEVSYIAKSQNNKDEARVNWSPSLLDVIMTLDWYLVTCHIWWMLLPDCPFSRSKTNFDWFDMGYLTWAA